MINEIAVFGALGHASVVVEAAELAGWEVRAIFDDNSALFGACPDRHEVMGDRESLLQWRDEAGIEQIVIAIGDNAARGALAEWLRARNFCLATIIHPSAIVSKHAEIEPGCCIMAGAVVSGRAHIGANSIINTCASVDHHCVLGENVHIAPGAHLCGNVHVGAGTFVGAGCIVVPGVRIGKSLRLRAGTVLVDHRLNEES
ncbi:MAG: acetyltransferase [Candidatus Eutrophobiaceae bacterium]